MVVPHITAQVFLPSSLFRLINYLQDTLYGKPSAMVMVMRTDTTIATGRLRHSLHIALKHSNLNLAS